MGTGREMVREGIKERKPERLGMDLAAKNAKNADPKGEYEQEGNGINNEATKKPRCCARPMAKSAEDGD
jgi:hypothetical protein